MAEDIALAGDIQEGQLEGILAVLEEDILVVLGEDNLVDQEVDIEKVVDILVGPVEDTQVVLEVGKHRHSDLPILVD